MSSQQDAKHTDPRAGKKKQGGAKGPSTRTILRWYWRTSKPFRLQACLNVVVGIIDVCLTFAFIAITKMAVDIATGRSDSSLNLATALLIGVIASQIAIGFSKKWIAALLGVKAQNKMQHKIFSLLLQSQWTGLEKRHSGDVLNRLERDVREVTSVITDTVPAAITVCMKLIGAFFYLYYMDAMLACILLFVAPVFVILSRLYVRKMRTITREIRETDSTIQSILTESVQHRMVLKTLERTGTMADRLAEAQALLRRQIRHRTLFSSFSGTLLSTGFAVGYLITFLWGVSSLKAGDITYGMMLAFIQLVGQIQGPFRDMTRFIPVIISSFTAAERLIELEDTPLEQSGAPIRFSQGAGIRINDVTYAYDEKKRNILSHLSYDFPPGSTTAILGETGAGKTTLIRLILALLKPQQGSIELYEPATDRTEQTSPLTRCNMVYVPQGNTLFSGTIRENLLLGNPDATETDMRWALQCACANFVLERSEGLDSPCGELGAGMSEGQAQRISIARALLRKGSILLLDEATSALDQDTEKQLISNLTSMLDSTQTVIFITHRPAIVEHCTQVLRLKREEQV